jgi:methanogenic corrinoid protein MtbC1
MAARKDKGDGERAALSIGALSAAVGIPVDTIRTWERRYGVPVAERKLSGHRVYPLSTVPRLLKIADAISRGHRAAEVVPASEKALDALLGSFPAIADVRQPPRRSERSHATSLAELIDAAKRFDAELIRRTFEIEWARMPGVEFLDSRLGAFLEAVGNAWADGSLEVRHEHFASAVVADFLRSLRRSLDERARGPVVVLTTMSGEMHGLGLQMSALAFALAGWRTVMLGVNSPIDEIVAIARDIEPAAIAISCVQSPGKKGEEQVAKLRKKIPRRTALILGGSGSAGVEIAGVESLGSLSDLEARLALR